MHLENINIRDPFIMPHGEYYYLYGTRSSTCWTEADGFDCYRSKDLNDWEGPFEIFHRPDGFELDRSYWAPECYEIKGKFYLLVTLGSEKIKKGAYLLISDNPLGPFQMYTSKLTPEDWTCIDGTLYQKDGYQYLIFSHSFEDGVLNGDMCMLELSKDLKCAITEPVVLFSADEASWAKPIPFAKEEFGIDEDVYFSDGPFLTEKSDGKLYMYWSGWSTRGYAVGEAYSETGEVRGPWIQKETPIFSEDGGHGMVFQRFDGKMIYTLHYPNDKYKEHPVFKEMDE